MTYLHGRPKLTPKAVVSILAYGDASECARGGIESGDSSEQRFSNKGWGFRIFFVLVWFFNSFLAC